MFKIEKGIPMPTSKLAKTEGKLEFLRSLKPGGDSFLLSDKTTLQVSSLITGLVKLGKRHGLDVKLVQRSTNDGIRVWRTA